MDWTNMAQDRDRVEGSYEHSNEPVLSIKYWGILELLRSWRLLKKC
jgi:hypothetical protein